MTRVDFYILQETANRNRFSLACKLAEKALATGHRVFIHTGSAEESRHMDRLLWTFREQGFLPHGLAGEVEPDLNPILIGNADPAVEERGVLINLATAVPTFFSRFERLAECVDGDESARSSGRDRYRFYRDRGYPLAVHDIQ